MKKVVWMSYDLGLRGDYEELYAWLDDQGAKECADGLAFFRYEIAEDEDIAQKLKEDIAENVNLSKKDRIYVIFKSDEMKMKGKFLFGKRKQAPWEGCGATQAEIEDDEES